jgi:7-alpha-hydroxysteroid dehydrogenase
VTGGGRGIGANIARELASAGAHVAVAARTRAQVEHVAREIGVPLERLLFLDDTEANLEAARRLGVKTVLVRSPEDVSRALRPWM